jgi:hypothetical protein
MKAKRELLAANAAALLFLLVVVLVLGWVEAAAFGLAVLVLMNLIVLLRHRLRPPAMDDPEDGDP